MMLIKRLIYRDNNVFFRFPIRTACSVIIRLHPPHHHANLPTSLQIQRPGVRTRVNQGAKRPRTLSRRFFSSAISFYGGCAWETFGSTGCLDCRFLTLRTAATQTCEKVRGSSSNQGAFTYVLLRLPHQTASPF